jgi:peptidoglycan/LPS O-acetylase OafA/YrhL
MKDGNRTRIDTFFLIVSWVYLIAALAMIGLALYGLTNENVKLTLGGVTDAVFAIIGGALGAATVIFGLISRNMKRCRLMALVLVVIAAVPLVIDLIAGQKFAVYWKNIAILILPVVYLISALLKRSAKKPAAEPAVSEAKNNGAETNGKLAAFFQHSKAVKRIGKPAMRRILAQCRFAGLCSGRQ